MLILCGSVSSWIRENIVSSTAFLGRPSWDIKLQDFTLRECNQFWPAQARVSPYEKLKISSVTGGVPCHLEEIDPGMSAEDNIRRLLFTPNNHLLKELDSIFSDTFGARTQIYRRIIQSLADGRASLKEILSAAERSKTGDYSAYLDDMASAGFIARDYMWSVVTGEQSKLSRYRLRDKFMRFFLRYVAPNVQQISSGRFAGRSVGSLPGWDMLSLQLGNLVVNNGQQVIRCLGVPPEDVLIHVNGVHRDVLKRQYFSRVIDFGELLGG